MNGRTLKFTWLVVGLALAVYFGLAPVPARAEPNASPLAFDDCGGINVSAANPSYEQQVVELVNAERANQGLPPLKRSTSLDSAARAHAEDMGRERYMAHDSQNPACVWSARVAKYYSNANSLAENIASGYSTPQDVMDGWMNSAGHRANILSASNWEIGVGYYPDGLYGTSWVQDFGRRSSFPPLVINRESAATTSPNITLYVYGSWSEIRLRNDSDAWSNWTAFRSELNWTLANRAGPQTVSAEMRSGSTTASASDTISLSVAVNYTNWVFIPLVRK